MISTNTIFQSLVDAELSFITREISAKHMNTLALEYLEFEKPDIDDIAYEYKGDAREQKRQLLIIWRNKNSAKSRQVK